MGWMKDAMKELWESVAPCEFIATGRGSPGADDDTRGRRFQTTTKSGRRARIKVWTPSLKGTNKGKTERF